MKKNTAKTLKKAYQEQSVLDAALDRIRYLYNTFDNVVVSFSGGKDSTAVMNVALQVAAERGKLPLVCNFYDEEAIHPTTIEYVERIRQNPNIQLNWYCLEFKHRNACSDEQPHWYCWEKDKRDIWVREMPEFAIRLHPRFKKGMTVPEFADCQDAELGRTVVLTGIRTQESLRRYVAVSRKVNENYIVQKRRGVSLAHPIYDWSSQDVWKLVEMWNLDYNRTYDIFNKTAHYEKFLTQRVCPPFGEEPLRGLWIYAECFPDMWHRMLYRVPGVATAWRYSNTELYGIKKDGDFQKPDDLSWMEYFEICLDRYSGADLLLVKKQIKKAITLHYNKTDDAIPQDEAHPLTGLSTKFLCFIAIKGDFKGRSLPRMLIESEKQLKKMGLTLAQAIERYGSKEYKAAKAYQADYLNSLKELK